MIFFVCITCILRKKTFLAFSDYKLIVSGGHSENDKKYKEIKKSQPGRPHTGHMTAVSCDSVRLFLGFSLHY